MRRAPNNNNFALTRPAGSSSWPRRRINGRGSSPDREEQGVNGHAHAAAVPWPPRLRPEEDSGSTYAPWMLFEERVRTGPFGLRRFPSRPHSPVRILVLDTNGIVGGGGSGAVDPALRQFVRDYSPPRLRGEWHLQLDAEPEDPGLTEEEFKKAMKKLRRHVHNPTYPRKRAWRRGLFSSRGGIVGNDVGGGAAEEENDEGKDCAICLETFGANEQVLMTPCSHMFHNDCIVPWVKSRGQCPVCRLELCERSRQRRGQQRESSALAAPDAAGPAGGVVFDDEILYLIRAMEEAFNWINLSR